MLRAGVWPPEVGRWDSIGNSTTFSRWQSPAASGEEFDFTPEGRPADWEEQLSYS